MGIPPKYLQLKDAVVEFEPLLIELMQALQNRDADRRDIATEQLCDWKLRHKDSGIVGNMYMALMAIVNKESASNDIEQAQELVEKVEGSMLRSALYDAIEAIRCLSVHNTVNVEVFASTASLKARSVK